MDDQNLKEILEICTKDLIELRTDVQKLEAIAGAGIEIDRTSVMRIAHRKFVLENIIRHIEVYIKMGEIDWEKEKPN